MNLSVIVPLYNAEAYIKQCLDSVLQQGLSLSEYEIIAVNDGSTDRSPAIVEALQAKYDNIVLVQQENQGNGAARNTGLDHARGKYIYFLDADDYLAHDTIAPLLKVALKEDLDVLGFESIGVQDSEQLATRTPDINFNDVQIQAGITYLAENEYRAEIWWYFIRREYLLHLGLRFYDRKFVQDSYYTPRIFLGASKIVFIPYDVHRYRKSNFSITRIKSPAHLRRHISDMVFALERIDILQSNLKTANKHPRAIKRLEGKKNRYAFLIFLRVLQSDLQNNEVEDLRLKLGSYGVYPVGQFVGQDYPQWVHEVLKIIINNKLLFKLAHFSYRKLKNR